MNNPMSLYNAMKHFDEHMMRAKSFKEANEVMKAQEEFFAAAIRNGDLDDQIRHPIND